MNKYTIIISCIILIFLLNITISTAFNFKKLKEKSNLKNDGYVVKHNIISNDKIKLIKRYWDNNEHEKIYKMLKNDKNIRSLYKDNLDQNYIMMDYVMYLSNSVIHTCHRDNNGSKFNDINDSYTMILYIDDMDKCLDIVPKSHKHQGIYHQDTTNTFVCSPGSIILFDSNMVHCGSLNSNKDNRRIQLKVTHKDDIEKLSLYKNYYKIMNKPNTNSNISKYIQKGFSCSYPIVADLTQGQNKDWASDKQEKSLFTKIYSKIFYSDKDYYTLKNAF